MQFPIVPAPKLFLTPVVCDVFVFLSSTCSGVRAIQSSDPSGPHPRFRLRPDLSPEEIMRAKESQTSRQFFVSEHALGFFSEEQQQEHFAKGRQAAQPKQT